MKAVVTHEHPKYDAVRVRGRKLPLGTEIELTEAEAKALEGMPGVRVGRTKEPSKETNE